jgi:hypothetical protein
VATALSSLGSALWAQDAREIVRKSVELDQANWLRLKDYTWTVHSTERHFDSAGKVRSEDKSAWETVMLKGEPFRRMVERNGRPLTPDEQRKENEKLDKNTARLARETPEQERQRIADYEKRRRSEREFLREIPDAYDLHIDAETQVDGNDVWVVSGTPKTGYRAKTRDAKAFSKIRGKIWIDKSSYQWVRVEAETTGTIAYGVLLARLNAGASLVFEQTRAAEALWLPKRLYMKGTGRLALLKKVAMDEEMNWSDYRKFQVTSKIVPLP